MSKPKTTLNESNPLDFLEKIENEERKKDSFEVLKLMESITDEPPKMWGGSIIGFGSYHYKYQSGREGDWMLTGFSPRKQALTLYVMPGFERYEELMNRLGKFKTGKSCLYIKTLEDIDRKVLKELVEKSVEKMRQTYS